MMPGMQDIGLRWRQTRFNPLRSLTPERLASALDQKDAGWLREASLIFETIEMREAIVRSVMTKRRAAVARRDWQIVVPDPENPNAEAHKATLEYFYNNLVVTDATDLNIRSGVSGLLRQMMDAVIQRYAVHEIVWKPGAGGLTAELRRVPLYFFENRSGRLRFVGAENRSDGVPLDEDGWMITVADGLGDALSICYIYKRLGLQDMLAFSEKFSVPGVLGRTSAKKGSDEGNAMRDSVMAYASEWVGLVYGDDGTIKDPIQVIQTPAGSSLPQMTICEYMDRMIATLVRGGDLSTISRDNSTGSNPQADETEALLEDDCALVSETLQTQLDRLVIRMVHGDETPAAYIVVNPPSTNDLTKDLAIDEGLARLGVNQDPDDLAERYGREIQEVQIQDSREEVEAIPAGNADPSIQESLDAVREALNADMQPLGAALAGALQAGDLPAMQAALRKISQGMPELLPVTSSLADEISMQMTDSFTGVSVAANDGNSEGARLGWETRRANGWVPAPRLITPAEADAELDRGFFVPNQAGEKIRFGAELKRKLDEKVINDADRNARKQRLRWAKLAVSDGSHETTRKHGNTRTIYAKTFRKGPKHQDVEVIVDTINGYAWNIMVKGGSADALR
jgi:phage gp29-like protein